MRSRVFFVGVLTLLVSPLLAQEGLPQPAPQLAPFSALVGNWKGEGTAVGMPGQPLVPWTSVSTWKPILGGHFYQEEVRVVFEPGAIPTMVFKSFYGFDQSKKRLVSYHVGTTGQLEVSENVHWLPDGSFVTLSTTSLGGIPAVGRGLMTRSGDKWEFKMEKAIGAGDFQVEVQGSMVPGDEACELKPEELGAGVALPHAGMTKLASICGHYSMTGRMLSAPGAPEMRISAKESISPLFGGAIIGMHIHGDPTPEAGGFAYEGLVFIGWDLERDCYREVWLNNMGETGMANLRWVGERTLVATNQGLLYGQPDVSRANLQLDESGGIQKVSMDRMSSDRDAVRAFIGEYQRLPK